MEADKADHIFLQKKIMLETSFSGSEGEELRFSYADSDDDSDLSDSLSNVSDLSDRAAIQRTLAEEMSFSGSDDSQDLSGEFVVDEKPGPQDLPCAECEDFLYTQHVRARSPFLLLLRIMAEPGQFGLNELALSHIRDCCVAFYANLDPADPKWL